MGNCPGLRYATANVALGDSPIWGRRQKPAVHSHPVYMLEYIKHGIMTFGLEGDAEVALGQGNYYITGPGVSHYHGVAVDLANIHVALRPEFVRRVVVECTGQADAGWPRFPGEARPASSALESVLRRMVQEARQETPWRRFLVDTLGAELIVQLLRDHGLVIADDAPAEMVDGITRAIELIMANYERDINLDLLAGEAGMSRYHFVRKFKERVGETPSAYVRQIRLEHAADLLRSTDLPVTEVAFRCGFGGPNRLAEAVRQAFGVTPGALRSRERKPVSS